MLWMDLRYAARLLRRSPVFTAVAVLTLSLGIGATTAIFSVVNAVLLRPLPFGRPERLMQVSETNEKLHIPLFNASVLNYLSWRDLNRSFDQLAAIGGASFNLSGQGDADQIAGSTITPSLMPVLGLTPLVGVAFREG